MNRRAFLLKGAAIAPASRILQAQIVADAAGQDDITRRYQLTRDRVISGVQPAYTPQLLLEDLRGGGRRRFTEFRGDVAGRWIAALSTASRVYGEYFDGLGDVVKSVLALQRPEGYFGDRFNGSDPGDADVALLWGNGRLLVGLMEYYTLSGDRAALTAAGKIGDFITASAPVFNSERMANRFDPTHYAESYICWTQCSEGLSLLYLANRVERYRQAVLHMAEHTRRRPGEHAHGYLTSLRGLLVLAAGTNDRKLLSLVEDRWKEIATGDLLVTGSVPEMWAPQNWRTEGCATCDWLRLSLALYRATGSATYLQAAQHALFNDFGMNQFSNGDFGHVTLNRFHAPKRPETHAWWCCTLHGMRAFPDVTQSTFIENGSNVALALPVSASLSLPGLQLESKSRLETDGTVRVRVRKASGHTFTAVQSDWAAPVQLEVNGRAIRGEQTVKLRDGDTVDVRYPMQVHEQQYGCGAAYSYGPWLLGASSNYNNGVPNEMFVTNQIEKGTLHHADQPELNAFAVPIAQIAGTFRDEEFPEEPDIIHLQPVAEQTGMASALWQVHWSRGIRCDGDTAGTAEERKHDAKVALTGGGAVLAAAACAGFGWLLGRRQQVRYSQSRV